MRSAWRPNLKLLTRTDLAVLIGVPLMFAVAWFYAPQAQGGPVICVFHNLTGAPCPGCGLTRSVCALVHGRWGQAIGQHPLGPLVALLIVGIWASVLAKSLSRPGLYRIVEKSAFVVFAVMCLAYVRTIYLFFAHQDGWQQVVHGNIVSRIVHWFG